MGKPKEEKKEKNEVTMLVYEVGKHMLTFDLKDSTVFIHIPEWKVMGN
jgi:hypothetical protein